MATARSDATELRYARTEIRNLYDKLSDLETAARSYKARAERAEQECAEWKRRFDQLLARDLKETST